MEEFKKYFFATYKIPTEFNQDFNIWSKIPWGELGVTIYIPGDTTYCQFNILTNVGLYGYNKNDGIKKVSYELTRLAASTSPRVSEYFKSDEVLFSKIIDKDSDFCKNNIESSFLIQKNIFDISLTDFITLVENEFNKKVEETLTKDFQVYRRDKEIGLDVPFETTLELELTKKSVSSFHRAFNKTKRYCNLKINQKYEKDFGTLSLDLFNKILTSHELAILKRNLDKELKPNLLANKRIKV